MDVTLSDSLRLHLDVPDRVRTGEPVPIGIRVQNVSGGPLDLYLRGRTIAFDIVVSREPGEIVWRRLEGEVIPAILRIETLRPGEVLELSDVWDRTALSAAGIHAAPAGWSHRPLRRPAAHVPAPTPPELSQEELKDFIARESGKISAAKKASSSGQSAA
jgi:hypothetical protein